jgi:hypothetical protein
MIGKISERRFYTVKPMYAWPKKIRLKFDISTNEGKKAMFEALKLKSMPPFSQVDYDRFFSRLPIIPNSNLIDTEALMILDEQTLTTLRFMEKRSEDNDDFDSLISIFIGRIGEGEDVLERIGA